MFGDVGESQPAFAFGSISPAAGQQAAQPAVCGAVARQQDGPRSVGRSDFDTDQKFQSGRLGGDMRADDSGQAVAISNRQRPISQCQRRLHQLVGVRRSFQKRKIRPAVQFGVSDCRRGTVHGDFNARELTRISISDRQTFSRRQLRHKRSKD